MALDEIFTYIGIGEVVKDINEEVLDSAKPPYIWRTSLNYNQQLKIIQVGKLNRLDKIDIKYDVLDNLIKIGNLPYKGDWKKMFKPLGKRIRNSKGTLDFFLRK